LNPMNLINNSNLTNQNTSNNDSLVNFINKQVEIKILEHTNQLEYSINSKLENMSKIIQELINRV